VIFDCQIEKMASYDGEGNVWETFEMVCAVDDAFGAFEFFYEAFLIPLLFC